MAKKPKVHTDGRHTTKFGDDKGQDYILAKNHDASRTRSMNQLRKLLCLNGERSYGMSCVTCESKCQFGMEYMKRQENEDVQYGE